jgi:hypothetical protein
MARRTFVTRALNGTFMRLNRRFLIALCTALSGAGGALVFHPSPAQAQIGPIGSSNPGQEQEQEDAKRKKREKEFGELNAPLPQLRNAGPCPYVKVLYDAARYVEFRNDAEASANVGFTGEIQNVVSACAYKATSPIQVKLQALFEFGRGPQAEGSRKSYQYWVAVTDRNHAVLAKEFFNLPVTFPAGRDRVTLAETLDDIMIPRANSKVSGANFEVLIGFVVTPAMAEFNRLGKRFHANAGDTPVQAASAAP